MVGGGGGFESKFSIQPSLKLNNSEKEGVRGGVKIEKRENLGQCPN